MEPIYLDNDHEPVWSGERRNTDTGTWEPAAGLTTLTYRISATDGGPSINVALEKTLAERVATPGEYFNIIDGDALRTHLLTLVGTFVFEVFGDGVNVLYSAPRKVVERRRP